VVRGRFLVVLVVVLAAAAGVLGAMTRPWGQGGDLSRLGATADLVPNARWPVRWEGNDSVVFQTWVGVTTVRLDGTVVSEKRETPSSPSTAPGAGMTVDADARFGNWRAWDGGSYLIAEGDEKCGPPLLLSPDGRYLACTHLVTDRQAESSKSYGAVVRLR
jgi:hypothetical protein